jgi:hypothetical protein
MIRVWTSHIIVTLNASEINAISGDSRKEKFN